jgi:hypothetical protein
VTHLVRPELEATIKGYGKRQGAHGTSLAKRVELFNSTDIEVYFS